MSGNRLTDMSVVSLLNHLSHSSCRLRVLDLSNCNLGESVASGIGHAIESLRQVLGRLVC